MKNGRYSQRFGKFKGASNAVIQAYANRTPEEKANYAYADSDGNDAESSGDGYRYRGRGLIQITHKDNYQRVADGGKRGGGGAPVDGLNQIYGSSYDLVQHPELLGEDDQLAVRSAT